MGEIVNALRARRHDTIASELVGTGEPGLQVAYVANALAVKGRPTGIGCG
jgi:hypothetical protein